MRGAWLIMIKDLRRRLRSPLAPCIMLAFPFLFSGLIALTFGGGGSSHTPRFKIVLVDEDGGLVARFVRGAFGQEQAAQFLEVTEATLAEATRLIERNRVAGAIVIPAGFSQAVFERRETQLRVIRNPASSIGAVAVEETAEFIALLLEGATNVLAEPLDRIRALTERAAAPGSPAAPDQDIASIAVTINHSMQGISRFAFPPAIYVQKPAPTGQANAQGDEFQVIFKAVLPGMAAFALFFLAVGLMADIFRERSAGTLARQLAAPVHVREVVFGKILATMGIGLLTAAVMALVGALLLGARADLAAFTLLCLTFLLAVTGFVSLLYSFARNEQQGGTLSSIVLMVMAFLGGTFIPLDAMPAFARSVAPLTLNYWAVRGFQTLLLSRAGIAQVAAPLVVFTVVGIVSVLAGGLVLQRRLMRGV